MANRIKGLLEEVEYTYLKIGSLYREARELYKEGKKGKAQGLAHNIKYLKKKMFNLRERFRFIIQGNVCFIKYIVQLEDQTQVTKNAVLVNVTNEEVEALLTIYCRFNKVKLHKILEIKRITTKLG
jgi:hypothetical protein